MSTEEALDIYKNRGASEKLLRRDKSYLGNNAFRIYSNESTRAKTFVEFVAQIIKNSFYQYIRKQRIGKGNKQNYLTVPISIQQLEKIGMVRLHN